MVGVGRRILPKCETRDEAEACLDLLSGRGHRVFTGLALVAGSGAVRRRLVETRLRFKRLSRGEVEAYLASGEWRGKAGGYAIQGLAGAFVERLVGSYSNVVGLPLAETAALLAGVGYHVHRRWDASTGAMTPSHNDPPASRPARPKTKRACPICGKPRSEAYDPFCSKRCADVDLHRWLKGSYVIPGAAAKPEPDNEE